MARDSNELRRERAHILEGLTALCNKAEREKRDLTKDEMARFDREIDQVDTLAAAIERADPSGKPFRRAAQSSLEELRAELKQPQHEPIRPDPQDGDGIYVGGESRMSIAPKGAHYAEMFDRQRRGLDSGGFNSLGEFVKAIHVGLADPRLSTRTMVEGTPSAGGFLIPEMFSAEILDTALEEEIVRPRATNWPMTSETRKIPGFDATSHVSNLYGGITATWVAEGESNTEVDAKFRTFTLRANKLAAYSKASSELIADGLNVDEQITQALIKGIAWYLDLAFLSTGDGVGRPLSILNDPALITCSKQAGQAASTICYENLTAMFSRLHPSLIGGAVFIANPTTIPQLLQLSHNVGTGGSHIPVMSESNGKFRILTKEILFTEKLPALGSKGDIVLCNLSQYAVGLRKEVMLERSNAVYWSQDLLAYRVLLRADGAGTWSGPIQPKNGSTLSWCACIEARTP